MGLTLALIGLLLVAGLVCGGVILWRLLAKPILLVEDPRIAKLEARQTEHAKLLADVQAVLPGILRPKPLVEIWLMDADERAIHRVLHVPTQMRETEIFDGGQCYRAAREAQPGFWRYRLVPQ